MADPTAAQKTAAVEAAAKAIIASVYGEDQTEGRWIQLSEIAVDAIWPIVSRLVAGAEQRGREQAAQAIEAHRDYLWELTNHGNPSHDVLTTVARLARGVSAPEPQPAEEQPARTRRLKACVEAWPGCHTFGYDPRCCRFPKSCSADIYDEEYVTDADLEPQPAEQQEK